MKYVNNFLIGLLLLAIMVGSAYLNNTEIKSVAKSVVLDRFTGHDGFLIINHLRTSPGSKNCIDLTPTELEWHYMENDQEVTQMGKKILRDGYLCGDQ